MAPMKAVAKAAAKKNAKEVKKDQPNKLTEENMNKHNEDILKKKFNDSDEVASYIAKMPKNQQMILWKKCLSQPLYVCVCSVCCFIRHVFIDI